MLYIQSYEEIFLNLEVY